MAKPNHDPGIENEPHLNAPSPAAHGNADERVTQSVHNEPAITADPRRAGQTVSHDLFCDCGYNLRGAIVGGPCPECGQVAVWKPRTADELAQHSVHNEPGVFPASPTQQIDREWRCSNCNHDLKGTVFGDPCPACEHVELYRPAPRDKPGYASWLQQRQASTSTATSLFIVFAATLLGGPWAVIGALLSNESGLIGIVTFGPICEEVMKIAIIAIIVEVRPYLIKTSAQLFLAATGSALMFSFIENMLYLNVYIDNPSHEIILWRWTACVGMHASCSFIAVSGLARVWKKTTTELRPPQLSRATPWLIAAIVVHGCFNGIAVLLQVTDVVQ
jgi:predicted RNA-binding Zn-ribbon protein involved in translation (DUF1610 family)